MDPIELKNLIIGFSKSFEEACHDLKKDNSNVNLEEAEITFNIDAEFDENLVQLSDNKIVKGIKFKNIRKPQNIVGGKSNALSKTEKTNLQLKITLTNNL